MCVLSSLPRDTTFSRVAFFFNLMFGWSTNIVKMWKIVERPTHFLALVILFLAYSSWIYKCTHFKQNKKDYNHAKGKIAPEAYVDNSSTVWRLILWPMEKYVSLIWDSSINIGLLKGAEGFLVALLGLGCYQDHKKKNVQTLWMKVTKVRHWGFPQANLLHEHKSINFKQNANKSNPVLYEGIILTIQG